MKCSIFCLLLAFCAFERVFAAKPNKFQVYLEKLRDDSNMKMINIELGLSESIRELERNADYPKVAEMDYNEHMVCWQAFTGFTKYLNTAFTTGDKCYDEALENKKIKITNNCYNKIIVGLEKEARLVRASSEECIANMVRKMATVKGRRRRAGKQSRRGVKNQ